MDIIIPSPRWERSDSMMPIDVWKKELPGVDVLACIETQAASRFGGMALTTAEMVRGIAGGYLSAGADGIYLNGEKCEGFEIIDTPEPKKAMEKDTVCYKCKTASAKGEKQKIKFCSDKATITWIELDV